MGNIVAWGNLKSVQVESSGVSKVFLKGILSTVYLHLTGISEVDIDPSSGAVCLLPCKPVEQGLSVSAQLYALLTCSQH